MFCDSALLDEPARLSALRRLAVLDTEPEAPFENVVALVRSVLDVPMAAVSLIDEDRQWFKARSGIGAEQTPRDISFCTHTIMQPDPLVVTDATTDPRFASNPLVAGEPGIRSYAGIPLRTADGYNVGSLCAIDFRPREFSASELAILTKFARIVVDELELRRIAGKDQLTGALTRRGFLERASQEIERFRRYDRPASLVLVDIDHFKAVNDTYGHPTGDRVLRQVAGLLQTCKRPNDVVGRIGGEEFGLLMPETGTNDALHAAERFRETIADTKIDVAPDSTVQVTASFGITNLTCAITDAESWFAAADAPLYAAKRNGRNRCVTGAMASADWF
ncbi:MAG: sensor domain-containing diguanylate cyclase [Sphingobium sp.]